MKSIKIYTMDWCPECKAAKSLFDELGVQYEEIDGTNDTKFREKIEEITGRRSVPQIIFDGKPIGGYDNLLLLKNSGKLPKILEIKQ